MPSNPTIEIAAFPEPDKLEDILLRFKSGDITIRQAMQEIETLEEANIRFQSLALQQAHIQLSDQARNEQHRDLVDLIRTIKAGFRGGI